MNTSTPTVTNRRAFERLHVNPAYALVDVRLLHEDDFSRSGHAYDISEGGLQFELDRSLAPGTELAMRIWVPTPDRDGEPGLALTPVYTLGRVVWLNDDEPGASRMALAFRLFCREGDRARLCSFLGTRRTRRAA